MISLALLAITALHAVPQLDLGKAEGACRRGELGPAFMVQVDGLKDRSGLLKLEVYPSTDADFLDDDTHLVEKGLVFRRVEVPPAPTGPVRICVRIPSPGRYAISLLHDRNGDHRFNISIDGIGFASNPKLGWSKPKASNASVIATSGITPTIIVMNYRHGLAMRPDRP